MKLADGQKIYAGGQSYKEEIPDSVVEKYKLKATIEKGTKVIAEKKVAAKAVQKKLDKSDADREKAKAKKKAAEHALQMKMKAEIAAAAEKEKTEEPPKPAPSTGPVK